MVPGVAQSWQQADPTTWVFKLRKDAQWSNGDRVTAQDFVHGWRRLVQGGADMAIAATTARMSIHARRLALALETPDDASC